MCGCADTNIDEELVDVDLAIEIVADALMENSDRDHIEIIPVAECGHVGRADLRSLDRERQLPVIEWFDSVRWLEETAAILFVVRSADLERISDGDLAIARAICDHVETRREPPWDLVFVTRRGNFKASELLKLPGHPAFESCAYSAGSRSEQRNM